MTRWAVLRCNGFGAWYVISGPHWFKWTARLHAIGQPRGRIGIARWQPGASRYVAEVATLTAWLDGAT